MSKYTNLKWLAATFALASLVGCLPESEESFSQMESFLGVSQKISLDSATINDIASHKVACRGGDKSKKEKICILLCHVPPGNPSNSHTKVLPLEATRAHLGHGDYLGSCDGKGSQPPADDSGSGSDDGNTGSDDTGSDEGNTGSDDTGSVDPTPTPVVVDDGDNGTGIPAWCLPFLEFDANCDGFNDFTGEAYL